MSEKVPVREGLFIEDDGGASLIGNKCKSCGQVFFPKAKPICLNCCGDQLEELLLNSRGKLYSYTVSQVPSWNFMPPYTVGYVELPENIRVFTQLKAVDDKPFKIGMEMELFIDKLWEKDGKDIFGYKYRPL
jgi:uncharacterized protein